MGGVGHGSDETPAAYLAGELRPRARRAFEAHLLACEVCWAEVEAGRVGRSLAEAGRVVAGPRIREDVRALLALTEGPVGATAAVRVPSPTPRSRLMWRPLMRLRPAMRWRPLMRLPRTGRLRVLLTAGAIALAVLAGLVVVEVPQRGGQAVLAAAVSAYRSDSLPGSAVPTLDPPDLSALQLDMVGGGAGRLGALAVSAYAYRDAIGRRLVVYVTDGSFPVAASAQLLRGPDGPWLAREAGVTMLCARAPHALLVLGRDGTLVESVGRALQVL